MTSSEATDGFGRGGIYFVLTYSESLQGFVHAKLVRQCSIIQLHLQSGHLYFANFLTERKNGLLCLFLGWRKLEGFFFLFCFSFVCLFWFFKTRVSLCSLGCPGTCSVEVGLKLKRFTCFCLPRAGTIGVCNLCLA